MSEPNRMEAAAPEPGRCPRCLGPLASGEQTCPRCNPPEPSEKAEDVLYLLDAGSASPSRYRYTLGALMLVIALVGICLGLMRGLPGLSVLILLVVTPALLRTLYGSLRSRRRGKSLTMLEKAELFLSSTGIVVMIALASVSAFVISCLPTSIMLSPLGTAGVIVAVGIGIVVVVWVDLPLMKRYWPIRERQ